MPRDALQELGYAIRQLRRRPVFPSARGRSDHRRHEGRRLRPTVQCSVRACPSTLQGEMFILVQSSRPQALVEPLRGADAEYRRPRPDVSTGNSRGPIPDLGGPGAGGACPHGDGRRHGAGNCHAGHLWRTRLARRRAGGTTADRRAGCPRVRLSQVSRRRLLASSQAEQQARRSGPRTKPLRRRH